MSLASIAGMLARVLIGAASGAGGQAMEGAIAMSQAIAMQQSINYHAQPGNRGRCGRHSSCWPAPASIRYEMAAFFESLSRVEGLARAGDSGAAAGSPGHQRAHRGRAQRAAQLPAGHAADPNR